ncbi:hypothetical protein GTY54_04310 [Streptomyces sp. SID625]|nr:hypothetical protein [Streptomyces sp. SID625]
MLQCIAITRVPPIEAYLALAAMEGGPEDPLESLTPDDIVLCELAQYPGHTAHAAVLYSAASVDHPDLWLFWTDDGCYRFPRLPPCLVQGKSGRFGREACMLYDQHASVHSWAMRDPLGDVVSEMVRKAMDETDDGP